MTKNGFSSLRVAPSTVTWDSAMASRRADWVRGVARFTSSARTTLAKTGPGMNSKVSARWSKMLTPVMSVGSRSGVHWMRRKVPAMEVATARASMVLPVPGTSCSSTWPAATMPVTTSRTVRSFPTTTRRTLSCRRVRSSVVRSDTSVLAILPAVCGTFEGGGTARIRARCRDLEAAWPEFMEMRRRYASPLNQLAHRLVVVPARWIGAVAVLASGTR